VFTGRARYILAAKVSFLDLDDGKTVFEDLYRSLTVADADADRGFATLAGALGFTSEEVLSLRARPSAIAEDLVAIVREHGHRSAHQGIGTALVLDRQLPRLFGAIADALATHYGIPEKSLAHLRYRAAEADAAEARVAALAARYLTGPFEVFEARRAGREVLWDLTALIDSTLMNSGRPSTGRPSTGRPSTGLTDSVAGR
jgi:pyrroloquinoline quinone (PQQ) biosynthesis protein C